MTPIFSTKIHVRCATCNDTEHSHEFEIRVIEHDGGWWVGQGKYQTYEEAENMAKKGAELLEKRNNQNQA